PIFMRLGHDYAKTDKGLKSQDLYLDILNLKKDYAGLKEYSKGLMRKGLSVARKAKLTIIYEEAYFLQVQKLEEDGKLAEAIPLYKKFALDNPKSKLAEKGWWNAVQLQFKTGDAKGGADAAVEFYERFPKSKDAVNALLKAAQTYETMAQLHQAAK